MRPDPEISDQEGYFGGGMGWEMSWRNRRMLDGAEDVGKNTKHNQKSMPKSPPKVDTEILPKSSKMSPRWGFGMAWSDFWGLTQDIVCQGRPPGAPHAHFLWILVLPRSTRGATWAISELFWMPPGPGKHPRMFNNLSRI